MNNFEENLEMEADLLQTALRIIGLLFPEHTVLIHCGQGKRDIHLQHMKCLREVNEGNLLELEQMIRNDEKDKTGHDFTLIPKRDGLRIETIQLKVASYLDFIEGGRSIILGPREQWRNLNYTWHLQIYANSNRDDYVFACLTPYRNGLQQWIWKHELLAVDAKRGNLSIVQSSKPKDNPDGIPFEWIFVPDIDPFGGTTRLFWTQEAREIWNKNTWMKARHGETEINPMGWPEGVPEKGDPSGYTNYWPSEQPR